MVYFASVTLFYNVAVLAYLFLWRRQMFSPRHSQMYLRLRPLLWGLVLPPFPLRQRDWARHQLHLLHLSLHPSLRLPLNRRQKSREKTAIAAREMILKAVTLEVREESRGTREKAIRVLLGLLLFSLGVLVGLLLIQ